MRIDQIELINFKCFEHLKAEFRPGVNLLVGTNGAGKTAILEGIAVALGAFFSNRLPGQHQRTIDRSENRLIGGISAGATEVKAFSKQIGYWSRAYNPDTQTNDTKNIKGAVHFASSFFEAFKVSNDQTIAPLISYQSTERLHGLANRDRKTDTKPEYNEGRRLGYWRALDERPLKKTIVQWLIDCIVDRSSHVNAGANFKDEQALQTVLDGVKSLLEYFEIADYNHNSPNDITIFPVKKFPGELMVKIADQALPLSYYSDGFRALVYLVMDLVWRAAVLNPWLSLSELSKQLKGVVLIDEIDLHLHPKWQGKAISFLQRLFPNVQYFISTHSSVVVANFKPRIDPKGMNLDALFTVKQSNELIRVNDRFFGKEVNDILTNILGANDRNIEVQHTIDQLFQSIDNGNLNNANEILNNLINIVGNDDAAVFRAQTMMNWKRFENENQTS